MSDTLDVTELRDSARKVLAKETGARSGYDEADEPSLYSLFVQLGWTALTAPEAAGGLCQSFQSLRPIYEEMGRALTSASFAGGMALLEELADDEIAERIVTGRARIAVGFGDPANGRVENVADGIDATHVLILSDVGCTAWLVECGESRGSPVETWDRSRRFVDQTLVDRDCRALPGEAIRAHIDLALACDSIGGAERALEEALTYMRTREQFGRPIGSFQALKHRAADLKVELELAAALTRASCAAFARRTNGWFAGAAAAKFAATAAYRAVSEESVQFHGGVGFTWEYDSHIYLKRAWLNEILGGTVASYLDRVGEAATADALS